MCRVKDFSKTHWRSVDLKSVFEIDPVSPRTFAGSKISVENALAARRSQGTCFRKDPVVPSKLAGSTIFRNRTVSRLIKRFRPGWSLTADRVDFSKTTLSEILVIILHLPSYFPNTCWRIEAFRNSCMTQMDACTSGHKFSACSWRPSRSPSVLALAELAEGLGVHPRPLTARPRPP